jgi:hypothetical protein
MMKSRIKCSYKSESGVLHSLSSTNVLTDVDSEGDCIIEHPEGIRFTEEEAEKWGFKMDLGIMYEFANEREINIL